MVKASPFEVKEIIPGEKYWKVRGINSQGKEFKYTFFENLTRPMNSEQMAEFYETEKEKGNPLPANSIKVYNIMNAAVQSENSSLINHLSKVLKNNWINALSIAQYSPVKGENGVFHNWNTSDEFFKQGIIYGPDSNLEELDSRQRGFLELILGDKNLKNLKEVSHRINKTPFYVWRFNPKPYEKIQRSVGFDANSGRLDLNANWNFSGEDPAFRVLPDKE